MGGGDPRRREGGEGSSLPVLPLGSGLLASVRGGAGRAESEPPQGRETCDGRAVPELEEVLDHLLAPSSCQDGLAREVRRLVARWTWFERLRKALKFRNGPVPLATTGHPSERALEHGWRRLDRLLGKLGSKRGGREGTTTNGSSVGLWAAYARIWSAGVASSWRRT